MYGPCALRLGHKSTEKTWSVNYSMDLELSKRYTFTLWSIHVHLPECSGLAFYLLIHAFVIKTSLTCTNLNGKEKWNLVFVFKWHHRGHCLLQIQMTPDNNNYHDLVKWQLTKWTATSLAGSSGKWVCLTRVDIHCNIAGQLQLYDKETLLCGITKC